MGNMRQNAVVIRLSFFHLILLPLKNDWDTTERLYADSLKNSESSHCNFSFLFCDKVFFYVCKWSRSVKSIKKDGDCCESGSERIFHPDCKANSLLLNEVFSFVSTFKFNTYKKEMMVLDIKSYSTRHKAEGWEKRRQEKLIFMVT